MKRALLIAFHFPPAAGTSGIHRAHSLAKYLRDYGWDSVVLTASERAHPVVRRESTNDLPRETRVVRAAAWDAARHFSIAGYYPEIFEWPDRWISWFPAATVHALRLVREARPSILWSTYPIITGHLVAMAVAKLTGLPWIADFRDSMTDQGYPAPGLRRKLIQRIESNVVHAASRVVFTAPGSRDMYASRYPGLHTAKWEIILNGYDEDQFAIAERLKVEPSRKLLLIHSGCIYPEERDPTSLFEAVALLHDSGQLSPDSLEIRLRATGHDEVFLPKLQALGIERIVTLEPATEYASALAEMLHADGLLLLQAASCNHQIPAKVFEYIRAGRPILALTDKNGDTARLLAQFRHAAVAPLDSTTAIADVLPSFLQGMRVASPGPDQEMILKFSRRAQVERTAELFESVVEKQVGAVANVTELTDSGRHGN